MIWQKKKIGDLINLKRGYDLPSSDRIEGEVPIISSAGITDYHNEFKKCGEGVVTGRYGTLGEVFYINGKYWPLNTTLYVTDFKGNDPKFIYYFLKTLKLERFNGAAAVPGLDRNVIHKVEVMFPKDFSIQRQIASILSSYDELIENNKQRIKLLEEMAEEIYKEWFVRMRFPGYETARFYNEEGKEVPHGTAGALPEGWEFLKIGNAFGIQGGGTPSTEKIEYWKEGTINWFSPTDITGSNSIFLNNSAKQITETGLNNSSAKLFPEKSVMMTSRATIGAVGINLTPACTNQGFITCIPNETFTYPYIYEWIKANKDLIVSFSSGATFKEISRGVFKNLDILKPELNILEKYTTLVEPMFDEIQLLGEKNQLLQQTRDLLLPRLISGKLSVEHLVEGDNGLSVAAESEVGYGVK